MSYTESMYFILGCVVVGMLAAIPILTWLDRPAKPKRSPRSSQG